MDGKRSISVPFQFPNGNVSEASSEALDILHRKEYASTYLLELLKQAINQRTNLVSITLGVLMKNTIFTP
jgi:hypothetical protein